EAHRVVHGGDAVAVADAGDAAGAVEAVAGGHAAAAQGGDAAGAAVQHDVVAEVRVEGRAFKDQAHALDLQLVERRRRVGALDVAPGPGQRHRVGQRVGLVIE